MKTFSMLEFSKLISINSRTLARWDTTGTFKACKRPSGLRFYTEKHYIDYCKQSGYPLDKSVLSEEQRRLLEEEERNSDKDAGQVTANEHIT